MLFNTSNITISEDLRQRYPKLLIGVFLSQTEENPTITDTPSGYLTELEKLGQSANGVGTPEYAVSPYTTEMRAVTDLTPLLNCQSAYLHTIEYFAYDVTQLGATGQNGVVTQAIYDSKTTNEIYALSQFLNGMMPINWQPNFFRPKFAINTNNMIEGISATNTGNKNNQGDLSIGLPLPICFSIQREVGKVTDIKSYGQVAQYINADGGKFLRYPIMCVATFYYGSYKYDG